jgi:hypothetical protein
MTMNIETGAIACDHTLPPVYYFTTWGGQRRIEANERLYETFFSDVDRNEVKEDARVGA